MENNSNNTPNTSSQEYVAASKAYYRSVHFWGQLTLALGMVFSCIAAVYFGFIKGYFPGWTPIMTAFLAIFWRNGSCLF